MRGGKEAIPPEIGEAGDPKQPHHLVDLRTPDTRDLAVGDHLDLGQDVAIGLGRGLGRVMREGGGFGGADAPVAWGGASGPDGTSGGVGPVPARAPVGVALQPGQEFNGGTVVDVAPAEGGAELLAVMPI